MIRNDGDISDILHAFSPLFRKASAQDLAYKVATKDQDALVEEHC